MDTAILKHHVSKLCESLSYQGWTYRHALDIVDLPFFMVARETLIYQWCSYNYASLILTAKNCAVTFHDSFLNGDERKTSPIR